MVLVEDGVEGAPQTTRFEITGEVRFTVSADGGDILVTAKPIANPFRIVASDDVAVGPVAASVTGRDAEIAAKRRQIEEIEADQAHIWKNGETGETVRQERFKKLGEPFEYEGEGYADPDAPEEIARLEQEIAALESGQAGSEPETGGEPAAETDATTSLTPEPGPGDAGGGARSASTNFGSTGPGSAQSGPIISLDSDLYNADKPVEVRFRVPEEGGLLRAYTLRKLSENWASKNYWDADDYVNREYLRAGKSPLLMWPVRVHEQLNDPFFDIAVQAYVNRSGGPIDGPIHYIRVVRQDPLLANAIKVVYRIKRVTLDLAGDGVRLRVMEEYFKAGKHGETWKQFLRRYGLKGSDLGPPAFNIKIEVEPHPNAFRNVAASDTPPRPPGAGGTTSGGGGSPPGGRPPDGGPPSSSGTGAAGGAEPENMQTMARLRQEMDELWENARARYMKGVEDGTDIMAHTADEFERAALSDMTLEAMESAVEEARRAGVPDDIIADHVANFRHFDRDASRMGQVDQLNERTLALEAVDAFIPMIDAGEMAILLGRVRAGTTSPEDLRNLRDLFQHSADQGGDFIDDLRRMHVLIPGEASEPMANAYTLQKLRELAERENLSPTRTAPPESPAPDLPPVPPAHWIKWNNASLVWTRRSGKRGVYRRKCWSEWVCRVKVPRTSPSQARGP